jgi:Transglutaminase-like superfamily/TgpA N-terminal domain
MSDLKALLERADRAVSGVPLQDDGLIGLQRRRDRKRRNERITAGVVGIAVFVAAVWIMTSGGAFDRAETPAAPGAAGTGLASDPFISIDAQLSGDQPAVDLFKVQTPDPQYWRLYALDLFDGTTWSSSDPLAEQGVVLASPASLKTALLPPSAEPFQQQFHILRDIEDPWLPMAHPAELVTVPFGEIRYNAGLSSVVLGDGLDEGLRYSVISRMVVPTPEELDLVTFDAPEVYDNWTVVPPSVDDRVRTLALQWTEDADTPYQKILALQDRFRSGRFAYSLDVEPVADSDALLNFLTESRRGFCEHFATAMAIMTRELGYPARIAVGYRTGTLQDDGTYLVQSNDAHAWVEVFFEGYGWLPFEPTPARGTHPNAQAGTYLNP